MLKTKKWYVKLRKFIDAEHQLCSSTGIYLAVRDFFYKSFSNYDAKNESIEPEHSSRYSDDDNKKEDKGNVINKGDGVVLKFGPLDATIILIEARLFPLVTKITRVVKIFRYFPTINDQYIQKLC